MDILFTVFLRALRFQSRWWKNCRLNDRRTTWVDHITINLQALMDEDWQRHLQSIEPYVISSGKPCETSVITTCLCEPPAPHKHLHRHQGYTSHTPKSCPTEMLLAPECQPLNIRVSINRQNTGRSNWWCRQLESWLLMCSNSIIHD